MSEYYEMIRHTRSHHDRLTKFCSPLFRNFGFNCLFYHYISQDGYGASFSTHLASFEYYLYNHLYRCNPYARHPDHFQDSIILIPEIDDQEYQKTIQLEANEFDIANKVIFLEKTSNGACQGFSFAVSQRDRHFNLSNLINNIPLLQCFLRQFKKEMKVFIKRVLEDQLNLADAIGSVYYSKPNIPQTSSQIEKKIAFLKQMGILNSLDEIDLTSRERDCMRLTLRGCTAGQIADSFRLSKRTIEHYLENVKMKANCDSKLELLEKFHEINALGLL